MNWVQLIRAFLATHPAARNHVDLDGDGYAKSVDCNDRDATINPAAVENCDNNIDENCDGVVSQLGAIYPDLDGDGHGDMNSGNVDDWACDNAVPEGYVYADRLDCDDSNPDTFLGAVEQLDGLDNDCDGTVTCEYPTEQADGSIVVMPTELRLSLSVLSPSGQTFVGRQEVLRFNLTVNSGCSDVEWQSGTLEYDWSDIAQTGWAPHDIDLYNLTDDGTSQTIWEGELDAVDSAYMAADEYLPAGQTKTFAVYTDLTGASSSQDDFIRASMHGMGLVWCSEGICSDASDSGPMHGFTLSF